MKQGKSPTRAQKIRMKSLPNPQNWLVERILPNGFNVVHVVTGEIRTLEFGRLGT